MNIITLLLVLASAFSLSACSLFPQQNSFPDDNISLDQSPTSAEQSSTPSSTDQNTDTMAALNTKYGQIVIKLYPDKAPNSVQNFLDKVNSGFYNNLTFHRVEPGFVVQGGDPQGNGTGGGQINSEINDQPFTRGSVGLARGPAKEYSNDSQFFICLSDLQCQHLTNEYVNIGRVVSGMDAVDQIQVGDKINSATTTTK